MLLIKQGYESHEPGPKMSRVQQVQQWIPRENPAVCRSTDQQIIRISVKTGKQGTAEKVLPESRPVAQMQVAYGPRHQELLKQVPFRLWSKHQTMWDWWVNFTLRPNARLPYERQYSIRGVKPISNGLLKGGVLVENNSPCNSTTFPFQKQHLKLVHDPWIVNAVVEADMPIVQDPLYHYQIFHQEHSGTKLLICVQCFSMCSSNQTPSTCLPSRMKGTITHTLMYQWVSLVALLCLTKCCLKIDKILT